MNMKFIDVNDDMINASKLIKSYGYTDEDFQEYDRVYPYTTELIDGYMSDSQDKTVLSVVGSGDHYLDLVCKGATTIDSFDINRLSLYYLLLKIAAVKALSKRDFFEFMTNNSLKHYNKIRPYLDMNSLRFWDYYINKYTKNTGIQDTNMFHYRTYGEDYLTSNIYMRDEGYSILQEEINKHNHEKLYAESVYSLPNVLNKTYDSIYLSNIITYQKDKDKFKDLVLDLSNFLNKDGELYYGYFYHDLDKGIDYYLSEIPETDTIEISRRNNKTDRVLVLKK